MEWCYVVPTEMNIFNQAGTFKLYAFYLGNIFVSKKCNTEKPGYSVIQGD